MGVFTPTVPVYVAVLSAILRIERFTALKVGALFISWRHACSSCCQAYRMYHPTDAYTRDSLICDVQCAGRRHFVRHIRSLCAGAHRQA